MQYPGAWLLLPLIGIVVGWQGRKNGAGRVLVLVCVIGFGLTLVGCGEAPTPQPGPTQPPVPQPPTQPPNTPTNSPTNTPTGTPTNAPTGTPTNTPTGTPTNTPTGTPTNTPTSTPTGTPTSIPPTPVPPTPYPPDSCPAEENIEWLPGLFTTSYYSVAVEWDPIFKGGEQVPAPTVNGDYVYNGRTYSDKFLYDGANGIPNRGSGRGINGEYISIEWLVSGGPDRSDLPGTTKFVEGLGAEVSPWRTVAVDNNVVGPRGTKIVIESVKNGAARSVTDSEGVFTVTDTGGRVRGNHIDIFIGELQLSEVKSISDQTPGVYGTRVGVIKP